MTDKLRHQAEALIQATESADKSPLSSEAAQQALHELRVHQIELELQNEELRRAQTELDAVRARYFDLYDMAPVGYCTVSEKGLTLEANLTAATLLGMLRGEMVGQPWTRFIHKEDQDIYYRHRKELFNNASPTARAECELRLVKKDGSEFWALLTGSIAPDDEGAPVCRIVIHDIAARKQEEQFREDVQSIIHHDIKGPLTSLYSLAELFLKGKMDDALMDVFPQVVLGVRQVIRLIDAAEPLREMERGEYTPAETLLEVHPLLESVKDSLAILSAQNDVTILLQPSAECVAGRARVCGEAFLFEDLFANLVKNAIEASPGGGSVTIACRVDPEVVHVAIHNTGAVPESIRDRFFEKYTTAGKRFGTGLGTYSARLITEAHGGHIGLATSEADGTTVSVSLPRCDIR
ncbi:Alkaline phosphatase synthesis sensor protein PhoR [Pseudodesulfovibrio hydrargyri]|jgi:PAS domain S-box-containing protein|uniref:histidine kinase n=1 Tax=Pseudodesulfovibrio hydrargyri TaxID=2125990 RepID=A0A1J5NFM6_9BACT|nr:PAS domain-containing sensor histidine kinase [Pseudodesulfovibrio hydrargyri]OIQ52023.1 Alkaline phosphatase synthesis sensor protein PhoR [Pseudodesulfovibrio hydrargyri]